MPHFGVFKQLLPSAITHLPTRLVNYLEREFQMFHLETKTRASQISYDIIYISCNYRTYSPLIDLRSRNFRANWPAYLHICSNKLSDFYIRIETGRDRPRSGAVRRFVNNKIPSIDEPLHISRIYTI